MARDVNTRTASRTIARAAGTLLVALILLGAGWLMFSVLLSWHPPRLNMIAVLFGAAGAICIVAADVAQGMKLSASDEPESRPVLAGRCRAVGGAFLLAASFYAIPSALLTLGM